MAEPATTSLEGLLTSLSTKLSVFEQSVNTKFSSLATSIESQINDLSTSVNGKIAQANSQTLAALNTWTGDINLQLNTLQTKVVDLYDVVHNQLGADIASIKQSIGEWVDKFKTLWESIDRQFENVQLSIEVATESINAHTEDLFETQRLWIEKNVIVRINESQTELEAKLASIKTEISVLDIKTQTYIEDAQDHIQDSIRAATVQTKGEIDALSSTVTDEIDSIKEGFSSLWEDLVKLLSDMWLDAKEFLTNMLSITTENITTGIEKANELMSKQGNPGAQ